MTKNNSFQSPVIDIDLSDMLREATAPSQTEPQSRTPKKLPGQKSSWQHFSVICDKTIVSKVHAIAKNEGFSVRDVVEYMLSTGIDAYEKKHGGIKENSKDIKNIF